MVKKAITKSWKVKFMQADDQLLFLKSAKLLIDNGSLHCVYVKHPATLQAGSQHIAFGHSISSFLK